MFKLEEEAVGVAPVFVGKLSVGSCSLLTSEEAEVLTDALCRTWASSMALEIIDIICCSYQTWLFLFVRLLFLQNAIGL